MARFLRLTSHSVRRSVFFGTCPNLFFSSAFTPFLDLYPIAPGVSSEALSSTHLFRIQTDAPVRCTVCYLSNFLPQLNVSFIVTDNSPTSLITDSSPLSSCKVACWTQATFPTVYTPTTLWSTRHYNKAASQQQAYLSLTDARDRFSSFKDSTVSDTIYAL